MAAGVSRGRRSAMSSGSLSPSFYILNDCPGNISGDVKQPVLLVPGRNLQVLTIYRAFLDMFLMMYHPHFLSFSTA